MTTLRDALASDVLLGASPSFKDLRPWRSWLDFLRAMSGEPLDAEGLDRFRRHTGRSEYRQRIYREAAAIVGRQSGKTRLASALVAWAAVSAPPVRDGERYAVLVAQDQRSAMRTAFSYVRSLFQASELLRREIVSETADTIKLANGVYVAAYPCRPAAVRGLRCVAVVVDELAHFISTDGRPTDTEMLRAIRPTLATTGGPLIVLSSPYGQSGALWDLHRRHFGRADSDVLVWQADASSMNPTLPADYLARMAEDDPEAYRSEVLGEFRAGLSTLLDPEQLDRCVRPEPLELAPRDGVSYVAFVDPSGGRSDAFTAAVAHREGELAVVDAVRAWPAPFNPSGVVAECATWLASYRVRKVVGDRFGGEWPREAFRSNRIEYQVADRDRSALYLDLLPLVNSQSVEVPPDAALLRELRGLERRRGPSGRDRVDHRPGAKDDRSNALAGAAVLVGKPKPHHGIFL